MQADKAIPTVNTKTRVIRSDNDKEFCGKAMLTWTQVRGVHLRLIEPGKPTRMPPSNVDGGILRGATEEGAGLVDTLRLCAVEVNPDSRSDRYSKRGWGTSPLADLRAYATAIRVGSAAGLTGPAAGQTQADMEFSLDGVDESE